MAAVESIFDCQLIAPPVSSAWLDCHWTVPRQVWTEHIQAARERADAGVGTGGYLQKWMLFDFGVLACISALLLIPFAWQSQQAYMANGTPLDVIMLRNTVYYIVMSWALMSFPFLIFHMPVIGAALSTPCAPPPERPPDDHLLFT